MSTVTLNYQLKFERTTDSPALGFFVAETLRAMADDMRLLEGAREAQGETVLYPVRYAGQTMLVELTPTYEVMP
jgi:hypothetical protein